MNGLQIINHLPGRIRFKCPGLFYNKAMARYINVYTDNLYGVKLSKVCHHTGTILVQFDIRKTDYKLLKKNIENAISSVLANKPEDLSRFGEYDKIIGKRDKALRKFIFFGAIYMILKMKESLYGKSPLSRNTVMLQAASAVTIIGGYPLLKGLYRKYAKNLPTDSEILLYLSALSFTIMRESAKGIMVLMLKSLNDYVKLAADAQGQRLLNQSMARMAGMAWIVASGGQEALVSVESLKEGDIISVHKGEIVPVEGEVIEGKTVVNSMYYTGQPIVTHIEKGNRVHEGLSVLSGDMKIRTAGLPMAGKKLDVSKGELHIHGQVSEYQHKITPASIGAAIVNYLLTKDIMKALSVLLVLTPSASGTALSTGIKSSVALLNKHKIYLRNPNVFEKIATTNRIIFDKTGTLTQGRMRIEKVHSFDENYPEREILRICAACEVDNYHPISVSIQEEVVDDYDVSKVQSSVLLPSKGVVALYDNHTVAVGNRALMEESGVAINEGLEIYQDYENKLYTPVFVGIDHKLAGMIVLKDVVREDSYDLVKRLKQRGLHNISLLSGDSYEKVADLASKLGISEAYGNYNCNDKARFVNEKRKSGSGTVIMVGDGVNDVQAMRDADASISFVNSACDKIKLNSDCIILEDNMTRLADFISLLRKSYNMISQGISASQAFNLAFGVLAFFGQFDAFTAKSLNTINSLIVLLLNKRIEYLNPEKADTQLG